MSQTSGPWGATSILGDCPHCGSIVPRAGLLAVFEPADDWPRMLATCPSCDEVVSPA